MHSHRFLELSVALYRRLILAYPSGFHSEYGWLMVQAFRDNARQRISRAGAFGLVRLWLDTGKDFLQSVPFEHLAEWRQTMKDNSRSPLALAGLALLIFPAFFAVVNFTHYLLGMETAFTGPIAFFDRLQASGLRWLIDALVLFAPPLALLLNITSALRVRLRPGEGIFLAVEVRNASLLRWAVVIFSVLLIAGFGAYFLAENSACFFGRQASC